MGPWPVAPKIPTCPRPSTASHLNSGLNRGCATTMLTVSNSPAKETICRAHDACQAGRPSAAAYPALGIALPGRARHGT
jgi:hypothetical protein